MAPNNGTIDRYVVSQLGNANRRLEAAAVSLQEEIGYLLRDLRRSVLPVNVNRIADRAAELAPLLAKIEMLREIDEINGADE